MNREPPCANRLAGPSPEVPAPLMPAQHEVPLRTVHAAGTQIYECRVSKLDPQQLEWAFVAHEADLVDDTGRVVGKHLEGPRWQSLDGSEVAGSVRASVPAPGDQAIPWLLLRTRSVGRDGEFARITSIQRINTRGGTPPATTYCTPRLIGTRALVPFHADYVLYAER
jgi:hypothetical protein